MCFFKIQPENARYAKTPAPNTHAISYYSQLYFFFFSSSFLFFSLLVLLANYVHSRSVVSGVHFFLAGLYSDSHENTPESWIWPPWIDFTRVGTRYVHTHISVQVVRGSKGGLRICYVAHSIKKILNGSNNLAFSKCIL